VIVIVVAALLGAGRSHPRQLPLEILFLALQSYQLTQKLAINGL
jgi:hypothetical protein